MEPQKIKKINLDKMGTLFIESNTEHKFYMPCPLYSHPETSRNCGETCPWFNIKQGEYEGNDGTFACCKEHVIGKIISDLRKSQLNKDNVIKDILRIYKKGQGMDGYSQLAAYNSLAGDIIDEQAAHRKEKEG